MKIIFAVTLPGSAILKSIAVMLGMRVIGMSMRIAVVTLLVKSLVMMGIMPVIGMRIPKKAEMRRAVVKASGTKSADAVAPTMRIADGPNRTGSLWPKRVCMMVAIPVMKRSFCKYHVISAGEYG